MIRDELQRSGQFDLGQMPVRHNSGPHVGGTMQPSIVSGPGQWIGIACVGSGADVTRQFRDRLLAGWTTVYKHELASQQKDQVSDE